MKPKAGKVVRLAPDLWKIVEAERSAKESIVACLRRLLKSSSMKGAKYFALPENGIILKATSIAEARGETILLRKKLKNPSEKPIEVYEK